MFKFKPVFLALVLSQTSASTLRSRELSEELFLSYEPQTTVTDHAAIDLDQQMIEAQLALGTDDGFQAALDVYKKGAHSKSNAHVTLDAALESDVGKGIVVVGKNAIGDEVNGKVMTEAKAGETVLKVQYDTTSVQESYVLCQVGGSPDPKIDGCFQPTGSLAVGAFGDLTYSYTVETDNHNGRTIQGFSHQAKEKMNDCDTCPYQTYKKFHNYYGQHDYGDQWVMAGFNKASTSNFKNGAADFSSYTEDGLNEVIKKGSAYLNVWMYVNRELEDAVDDCSNTCATEACNDDQVHAWDEAVAFYTGSIPKKSGDGGVLLYTLAQKRCENFGTCLSDGENAGMAGVNDQIFAHFDAGKQKLQQGKCSNAKSLVKEITALMSVPMIQGTIRYAHIQGEQKQATEQAEAEGATFAAAVLPILHHCNAGDAQTVYDNMKTGSGASTNFAAVKAAFEKNYDCMGVSCEAVGGLLQADNESFFEGAEPCTFSTSASEANSNSASAAFESGITLAVGVTGIVAALI